ncbi:MAG: protein kinase [Isosphaeraceae bacterium]
MKSETQIDALLSLWHEGFARGRDVPATELCRDRPDLIPELQRRIDAQRGMAAVLAGVVDDSETHAEPRTDPEATAASPRPSRIVVPGYEVLGLLGEGGMGAVYQARDRRLKRLVALKVLRGGATASTSLRERIRAEAEAVARLQHPHIVQIFEFNEWQPPDGDAALPFLALEYVSGGGLDSVLARGPLELSEAARLVGVLARAVHAAHEAGVVHRDLKPANVLLGPNVPGSSGNFPFGFPKVSDFGLSLLLDVDQRQTASGTVMGTPAYMAPEQAEGRADVGPAADVWALGVILYEALTGRVPFRGDSVLTTLELIRKTTPAPPRRLRGEVTCDLEAICLKCLEKSPTDRHETAAALADDLDRFLAGTPIHRSAPRSTPRVGGTWRGLAAAGATIVAALLAASTWWPVKPSSPARSAPTVIRPRSTVARRAVPEYQGWVDVKVWRPGEPARRLGDPGALPLHGGDLFRVEARIEPAAYLYLFWIDSGGSVVPVFPWRPGNWEERTAEESPRDRLELPLSADAGWSLDDAPDGMETLLLLARPTPLPGDLGALKSALADLPPQRPIQDPRSAVWFENGVIADRRAEGRTRSHFIETKIDDPVLRVQGLLRDRLRSLAPFTSAVCFARLRKTEIE